MWTCYYQLYMIIDNFKLTTYLLKKVKVFCVHNYNKRNIMLHFIQGWSNTISSNHHLAKFRLGGRENEMCGMKEDIPIPSFSFIVHALCSFLLAFGKHTCSYIGLKALRSRYLLSAWLLSAACFSMFSALSLSALHYGGLCIKNEFYE